MNHLDDDEGVFQGQFTKREEKIIIFVGVGGESKRDSNLLILMKKDMLMNERRWLAY